jgi:voltage-gated potassium channel
MLGMHHVYVLLKRFLSLIRREEFSRVFLVVLLIALAGSLGFMFFEKGTRFMDALWWAVVTLTTVGYGDISPATPGGKVIGMVVMVSGIGFLGILTAGIAGMFIERKFLENRGMKAVNVENHFIICGWGFNGRKIVE